MKYLYWVARVVSGEFDPGVILGDKILDLRGGKGGNCKVWEGEAVVEQ